MSGARPGAQAALLVGFGVFVITMIGFFRVTLLPDIGHDLSLSASDLGLITTSFAVGRLFIDLPAGRMADRWSVSANQSFAAASVAAASLVLAVAGTLGMVLAASFVMGVASAVSNTVGQTFFSTTAPAERRGTAVARFSSALLVGQSIGPAVAGLLTAVGTWRTAVGTGAAIAACLVVVIAVGARRLGGGNLGVQPAALDPSAAPVPAVRPIQRAVLYSVPFVSFFTFGSLPQTVVPLIGADSLGLDAAAIGLALGLAGVCRFIGTLISGWVSDHVSRKAALVPGLAASAVGAALLSWEGSNAAWLAAIVVMSLASAPISVATTMLADLAGGQRVGRKLGPFRFVGDVGMIAGPLVVTLILEHAGTTSAVLTVAGVLTTCALACALILPDTRGSAESGAHGLRPDGPDYP